MGIVGWIVLGLLAGLIAKKIMPGAERIGIVITTLLGIGGALLAASSPRARVRRSDRRVLRPQHVARAIVGALILLYLWNLIHKRRIV